MDEERILLESLGLVRVGAAIPSLRVTDVTHNVQRMEELIEEAEERHVQILAFPELAVTGYTCGDLFLQQTLLDRAEAGLSTLLHRTASSPALVIVGCPIRAQGRLYNTAVLMQAGRILGVVPKTYLPNYREFYEERWFASARESLEDHVTVCGQRVPFGTDLLFRSGPVTLGVEICEDLWVPLSPHEFQAHAGANVLVNISASNEVIGKAEWRRTLVSSESGRCIAAYVYVSSGFGESTNDVIYGGHAIIAENGLLLKESERYQRSNQLVVQDVDIGRLAHDRRLTNSFGDGVHYIPRPFRQIEFSMVPVEAVVERFIDPHPFVPAAEKERDQRCEEIFHDLVTGLAKKLGELQRATGIDKALLGVSGGLDSTLAALVLAKTLDYLGWPRANGHVFTLPGFGTTARTRRNALRLGRALGLTTAQISIVRASQQHLRNLGHDLVTEDITFENVQARYRTEFLFNKSNQIGGIVVGTGDLTEIALGWCTFSGDQLSHYHVNCSVPKTLVKYLIRWVADTQVDAATRKTLEDILDTPISPELRRPVNGVITQHSEAAVGPFELADFYLYQFVRQGKLPSQMLLLAHLANRRAQFSVPYTLDELYRWLRTFITRFFANQFKRTCMPEGPKIGTVSLSPRGDWRMPSDAVPDLWLEDLDAAYARLRARSREPASASTGETTRVG